MAATWRHCKEYSYVFCYIYGEYKVRESRESISEFVQRAYLKYFGANSIVGSPYCKQNLYGAFVTMAKWKTQLREFWCTNGLEETGKLFS
ncbi:hypothetical protein PR048_003081 [Dryococelus australis]|uniref:Uncharacterized protein n=1 Tax=Dryococelus australis TaxID=614101 RepID=A0ABQ9IM50_9NEOP|nr:hypothetical protein PR048_003081 [Dryococelus australis]